MLSIDTSCLDDHEMEEEPQEKVIGNHHDHAESIAPNETPTIGVHPDQHSTEKHTSKQQHLYESRTSSTQTTFASSLDHSNHTRSSRSKNSRSTKSSNGDKSNANGIVVSSFSNLATQSIEDGKYQQALEYYQLALQDYTKDTSKSTVVELVNAAATCFNLGALAKKLRDYSQAAQYFEQAQDIYRQSGALVETFVRSGGSNTPSSPSAVASVSSASASTHACQVCLLQLIVETLHARAHLHYKYQSLMDDAVECHEEIIELLEERHTINNSRHESEFRSSSLEHDVVYHKIHFTTLSRCQRWQFLVTSLQALGKFYVEKGELEDAIVAYNDALSILKKLHEHQIESTLQRQEEILQILGALSDFYMQNNLESTDVVKLERAAVLQEDLGQWEKAMQCWERMLYCQSREYGDDSLEVSITLGQLARVMVIEGNLEGALDLYQATASISLRNTQNQITCSDSKSATKGDCVVFSIPEEIFSGILNIFHELDRIPDAIAWLKSLLSKSERREDQARTQLELGKLYLHQGFIHDASNALYLSLELFDGEDESAFELLQQVEFLGATCNQKSNSMDVHSNGIVEENGGVDCLTAIIEDGESAFLNENRSALSSSIGGALSDGNIKIMEEDDCDSEDLSKVMIAIDQADGSNPHERSQQLNDPTIETAKMLHDTDRKSDIIIQDENEEKFSLPDHLKGADKEQSEHRSEIKLMSPKNPEFSIRGSSLLATSTGTPENIDTNSNLSSSGKIVELRNDDIRQPELQPNHELMASGPTPRVDINNQCGEINEEQLGDVDFQYNPIMHQNSANSRTPLLTSAEKPDTAEVPTGLSRIAKITLSSKYTQDEKTSTSRKSRTETKQSGKQTGGTGRKRIVKALSSPFRRSRSKSRSMNINLLNPLDEEKEIRQLMPTEKKIKDPKEDESCYSKEAPISYIDVRGTSDDERSLVSQLTFREYELLSKKKEKQNASGHWWWGVTAEGLEGWFPSDYVNQAVEAAEGFLSAKSIHDRVKSRPLDFDSDEESDDVDEEFSLLKDSISQPSKSKGIMNDSEKISLSKPSDLSRQSCKKSSESSAGKEIDDSISCSNKSQSLESLIHEKEIELEARRSENGLEDISVARVLFDLAELHFRRKDSRIAILCARQAMKIQKSTLHLPEACKSLKFMAQVHSREKAYKDALLCYSEVQRIHEALYGYFHEEIATDLNHCGHTLARQGKFQPAMEKHKEALRILKDCCGENVKNPLVSETLIQIGAVYYKERNSLANIQSKQNDGYKTFIEGGMLEVIGRAHEDRGSYRMAIAFFEEKLQILNDGKSSSDSEDIAETLNSLGMLSCRAGMYLEAIDYYDRALGIQMKLGCDEVQLAMLRVLAGSVQYSLGHFSKALKLFQDALGTLRQVGLEQETVAATLFHIGVVHASLCNYDDAMANLRDAFDIQSKLLGTEHAATFRTRREIGNLYAVYESEVDAAFDEFNDIVKAQKRVHGEKHPYVAETLHSIGCAQARKGDLSGALRTLEDCYNMRLQFLGMDHPQQATTLHEIAKIQLKRGRLKKAIHIIDAALNIRVESLSEHHIDVALAMTTKASCLVARVNFSDANKLFIEALPIAKAAVGDLHPSVAWIHVQIGVMHLRKCNFEEASSSVKKAIAIYRHSDLDDDHPGIMEANEELERIERAEMLCV